VGGIGGGDAGLVWQSLVSYGSDGRHSVITPDRGVRRVSLEG